MNNVKGVVTQNEINWNKLREGDANTRFKH